MISLRVTPCYLSDRSNENLSYNPRNDSLRNCQKEHRGLLVLVHFSLWQNRASRYYGTQAQQSREIGKWIGKRKLSSMMNSHKINFIALDLSINHKILVQ